MEWISVKDKLPSFSEIVIFTDGKGVTTGCMLDDKLWSGGEIWLDWVGYRQNPTHWMPLPEPPKED